MSIRISRGLLGQILAHAASEPAREVCGLLLTTAPIALSWSEDHPFLESEKERPWLRQAQREWVDSARRTTNVALNPADSFEIDPAALFAAIRAERAGGPRLVGHYHSHPNGNAMPSRRDAEAATMPNRVWLILAAGETRLWREVPGGPVRGAFEACPLVVDEGING
jgi:proteasome lid subunit RPN8/RPN11